MKQIYLVRHAQSESNAGLTVRPNEQIILTELGHRQAHEVAQWLSTHIPSPDGIFISPYMRTQQTAQPYLDITGLTPIVIDDLREFNYLDFEHIKHLSYPQIIKMADDFWAIGNPKYADSENTDDFDNLIKRVRSVRSQLDALTDGTYVVFTHGMWLGMLMWQLIHHDSTRVHHMIQFRQFELAVRPKNCEVFLLQNNATGQMSIAKVRARGDD